MRFQGLKTLATPACPPGKERKAGRLSVAAAVNDKDQQDQSPRAKGRHPKWDAPATSPSHQGLDRYAERASIRAR